MAQSLMLVKTQIPTKLCRIATPNYGNYRENRMARHLKPLWQKLRPVNTALLIDSVIIFSQRFKMQGIGFH
jgi:hypothetical protein